MVWERVYIYLHSYAKEKSSEKREMSTIDITEQLGEN